MNLIDLIDKEREPYFICVGTTRSSLDSVAPKVGTRLEKLGYKVIGTEENQLHGLNIVDRFNEIESIDLSKYQIIAIDGMYAHKSHKEIIIENRPLRPGGFYKKTLPEIGEFIIGLNINRDLNYNPDKFHEEVGKSEGYNYIVIPLADTCIKMIKSVFGGIRHEEDV